jgi:Zn-dependent protease
MDQVIQTIALGAIPMIFAITLHEAAHGYAARHFGDLTAYQQGRISLNPARHIDPLGTIVLPALMLLMSGGRFAFGWAKPVPVNFGRLRNPKRDMFWVAAAGPGANLAMALAWALVGRLALEAPAGYFTTPLFGMALFGIRINMILMVLNLLPLPPLDGGRIAVSLLPHGLAWKFARIEPWGMWILVALMFTGVLSAIIGPIVSAGVGLILGLFGLSY